jgi:hypothetical protein
MHGLSGMAYPVFWMDPEEVPSKSLPVMGALLAQRPLRRRWDFDRGIIGRHNPELRRRLQEVNGE